MTVEVEQEPGAGRRSANDGARSSHADSSLGLTASSAPMLASVPLVARVHAAHSQCVSLPPSPPVQTSLPRVPAWP